MSPFCQKNSGNAGMDPKAVIKRNFSRHARRYDSFSLIQDKVGGELLSLVPEREVNSILDVGCGTGTFTQALAERFGHAQITALDLCPGMIAAARDKLNSERIKWVCADAESVVLDQRFDLIVSNACFQWFDDLPQTVQKYRDRLNAGGILAFSAFGPSTFLELNQVMRSAWGESVKVHSGIFNGIGVYRTVLRNGWAGVSIQETIHSQIYDTLWDLLFTIKYTGTKGYGLAQRPLTRAQISALERDYRACFGQIRASYQVFCCTAMRKD